MAPHRAAAPVEQADLGVTATILDGAPRWVSGLLAGVQAAVLSLLVVVTPSLAAYVATSADPANAEVGWPRSVVVGAALWLMGHGGAVRVDGVAITIVPLGITALALFAAYASARRSAQPVRSAWFAGVGGYVAVVALVTVLAGAAGPLGAGGAALARVAVGGTLVACVGLALGMVRPAGWRAVTRPVWSRVPPLLRAGVRAGVLVTALLVCVAAAVVTMWAVSGRAAAGDVIAGLGLETFSGLLLAFAQLSFVPNLVLWAVGWLAGPGFAVGAGTVFSPAEVTSGPLPALPLLGALPTSGGGPLRWAPLVVVVAGGVAGWWLHRRLAPTTWRQPFAAAAGTAAVAGLSTALLVGLSGGAVGPGRLAVVGASALLVGAMVAGATLVGVLVVLAPADRAFRSAVAAGVRRGTRRGDGVGAPGRVPGVRAAAAPDAARDDA